MEHAVLKGLDVLSFQDTVIIILEGDDENTACVLDPFKALELAEKIAAASRRALRVKDCRNKGDTWEG